jgi:hypothetical protein
VTPEQAIALANARKRASEAGDTSWLRQFGRRADDAIRSIASGATFGFADELAAGASTLTGLGRQEGAGEDFASNLAAERARDKEIPAYTRIPGEVVGGIATGVGAGRAGLTLLNAAKPTYPSMMARGALEGAGYGAAYGAGSAEGDIQDRLAGAAHGATIGAAAGGAMGAVGARMARPKAPTTEALRARADNAYKAAKDAGVVIGRNRFLDLVDDIAATVQKEGIDRTLHPNATAALGRLMEAKGTRISLEEAETLRRILRNAAASKNPGESRLGNIMIDKLDDFVDRLNPSDFSLIAGDKAGVESLQSARGLWSRVRKGEAIDDLIDRAGIRAQQFSGSGYENALRTEFRQLAMNKNKMRGFSEEEQAAIRRVAEGGPIENALRFLGKLAPRGVVSGGFHLGVGAASSPLVGAATMIAGEGARRGATALTSRNARLASELMRAGGETLHPVPLTPLALELLRGATIAEASQAPGIYDGRLTRALMAR